MPLTGVSLSWTVGRDGSHVFCTRSTMSGGLRKPSRSYRKTILQAVAWPQRIPLSWSCSPPNAVGASRSVISSDIGARRAGDVFGLLADAASTPPEYLARSTLPTSTAAAATNVELEGRVARLEGELATLKEVVRLIGIAHRATMDAVTLLVAPANQLEAR